MVTLADHSLLVAIMVAWPLYAYLSYPRLMRALREGRTEERLYAYWETMIVEWLGAIALLVMWWRLERSPVNIGLVPEALIAFGVSTVVGAILIVLYTRQVAAVRAYSAAEIAKARHQFGKVIPFLPATQRELRTFMALAVTAGVTEELLFRGFLYWYLAQYMGLPFAVAVATLWFGLAHSYQGTGGAARAGALGLLLGLVYLWTGSLYLSIVLHIAVDVVGGLIGFEVVRRSSPDMARA